MASDRIGGVVDDLRLPADPASTARRSATASVLTNIQGLRAAAALAVLVSHISHYVDVKRSGSVAAFDGRFGALGVAVFFAISGFLMAGLVGRQEPWAFLGHRVVRIFPPFLIVACTASLAFSALGIPTAISPVALSLAPVGTLVYPLGVEWTLVFETSFYVALFLLALAGGTRHLVPIAAGWLALLALACVTQVPDVAAYGLPPLHILPFASANAAFAGGLLLPWLIRRRLCPPILALAAAPLAYWSGRLEPEAARWFAGLAGVLIVAAALQLRQASPASLAGRVMRTLGDWSYVLYLVHVPVTMIVLARLPASWSPAAAWTACAAAVLTVTALFGPADLALYRRLRALIDAAPRRTLKVAGLAYLAMFFGVGGVESARLERRAWQRHRIEAALAVLPADAVATREGAERAVAALPKAAAPTVRAGLDKVERWGGGEAMLTAWAVDAAAPDTDLLLAVFCDGRRIVLDRATRLRPDMAGRPGLEAFRRKRIGYRTLVPIDACPGEIVGLVVAADGRMAVLRGTGRIPPP